MSKPNPDFICGISFRGDGVAAFVVQTQRDNECRLKVLGFRKSDIVSIQEICDFLLQILPKFSKEHSAYVASGDIAACEDVASRLRKQWGERVFPELSLSEKGQEKMKQVKPSQYVAHLLSELNEGFVGKDDELDLNPFIDDLATIEFGDDGQIKNCVPLAEAMLYSLGKISTYIHAGEYGLRGRGDFASFKPQRPEMRPMYRITEGFIRHPDPLDPSNLPQG